MRGKSKGIGGRDACLVAPERVQGKIGMLPPLGGCQLPPSTSSHTRAAVTAHRVEVLGTLRTFAAHLLLGLQLWLRLVDGLPAVATIARPTAAIPVGRYTVPSLPA